MRRKRRFTPESPGSPGWMNSFADLMCLLLTFFILLYSFSVLDVKKLENFLASFQKQGIVNQKEDPEQDENPDVSIPVSEDMDQAVLDPDLVELYRGIMDYLAENDLHEDVSLRFVPRGLVLTIKDRLLFDSGKAMLREDSKKILARLAGLFSSLNNDIAVEGHTDNIPINRGSFPTNWELSTARAISVVRFFTEEKNLDSEKFAATGFGEWQPVAPNDTEENRQLNRRVIIKIFSSGAGHREEMLYHENSSADVQ